MGAVHDQENRRHRDHRGSLICLSADTKDGVHKLVDTAVKAGAKEPRPMADYGFMIQRTFEDLDGHTFEVIYMDPTYVQK